MSEMSGNVSSNNELTNSIRSQMEDMRKISGASTSQLGQLMLL